MLMDGKEAAFTVRRMFEVVRETDFRFMITNIKQVDGVWSVGCTVGQTDYIVDVNDSDRGILQIKRGVVGDYTKLNEVKAIVDYVDAKIEYELCTALDVDEDGYRGSCVLERKAMEKALNELNNRLD